MGKKEISRRGWMTLDGMVGGQGRSLIAATADRAEILRGLQIYHDPGDVFEFRLPDAGKHRTISGYFNDFNKAADNAVKMAEKQPGLAIYCTINPTNPRLIGRANNTFKLNAKNTTSDKDIVRLNWLPIDADPPRPAGISASDEEHDLSISRIRDIKNWLIEDQGWPDRSIVIVDSGNGGYLLARIELENDLEGAKENTGLVAACLKALDYLFSDDSFHVDPTSQNPSRILRVPGTLNAKGDEVEELAMKHRAAKILDAPDSFEVVPKSKLESLAAMLPVQEAQPKSCAGSNNGFDPVKYCHDHNLSVHHSKTWLDPKGQPCTMAVLDECIFNPDHHLSAVIIGWPNGTRTYRCRHNSCLDKHWQDAKSKIEPFKSSLDNNLSRLENIKRERIDQKFKAEPEPEISIPELEARVKVDPRILKDPAIIKFMAGLRANDPIEFELLIEAIKRARVGVKVATIAAVLDTYDLENQRATESPTETSEGISEEASDIIDSGEAFEYIYEVWQRRVKGNEYLGKALLLSRGVQSCLNTKGLHIYAHGKRGHGKSEGMEKMIELIPPEYKMDEDVSPLAIHYASQNGMLLEGTTLLIDEMIWNDSLAGIIKRVITRFQKGAGHLTVLDGVPILVRTQPRLAIWTNSADLQADEQLRDRFLDEPIDEGDNYVREIIEFQKIRDTLPKSTEDIGRENAICQTILRDLACKKFIVKIPFANRIRIEESEGARGYNIFSDLVKGIAAMRYTQRQTNEQGQLLAAEGDFKIAKEVYEGSKGHSEESYTTAEKRVLQAIIDHGHKALYKDIKCITGMSEGRIKDIVNGRGKDEQRRHGLRYKCPQLDVSVVDISTVIAGTYNDRVTTHPVELSLPTSFNVDNGIRKNLVTLDPDVVRRSPDVDPDVDIIDNKTDSEVVDVIKEERGKERDIVGGNGLLDHIPSYLPPKGQNPTSTTSRAQTMANPTTSPSYDSHDPTLEDGDSSLRQGLRPIESRSVNVSVGGTSETSETPGMSQTIEPIVDGIKADLRRADEQTKAKEDHFRTPSKVRWIEDQPQPEKNCGSCLYTLNGDKSAIRCSPCHYQGKAKE